MIPYVYPSLTEQFNGQMAVFELLLITAVLIGGLFLESASGPMMRYHKKTSHQSK